MDLFSYFSHLDNDRLSILEIRACNRVPGLFPHRYTEVNASLVMFDSLLCTRWRSLESICLCDGYGFKHNSPHSKRQRFFDNLVSQNHR